MPLAAKVKEVLTAGMNRLIPLIDRRPRAAAAALALPPGCMPQLREDPEPGWLKDARLFGASYLSGIVVFSTFLA